MMHDVSRPRPRRDNGREAGKVVFRLASVQPSSAHWIGLLLVVVLVVLPWSAAAAAVTLPPPQDGPPPSLPRSSVPLETRYLPTGQPTGDSMPEIEGLPDWSRIAFQSYHDDNFEIYLARGDGSNKTRLTTNPASDLYPRLNRGATRVVFASQRDGDDFEIYTMRVDGSGVTQLTNNNSDDAYPNWSPDSSKIVFTAYRDGQAEVYRMNVDGSAQTRLTNSSGYDSQPAWSPDGSKIAFTARRDDQLQVWVMNPDGSGQRRLSYGNICEGPAWSPDGSQIAMDCDGNGDTWQEIWLMNADGSNARQVYDPPENETDAWVRSWSPDGRYVAFSRIKWIWYQGNWYWTSAYLDAWDTTQPGQTIRLSNWGVDLYPDWQTTDIQAPTSLVQPLPAVSPATFTVRWAGSDSGASGLRSFDVQVKEGASGTWTNWKMATTATSAPYTGTGGRVVSFRARARDNAGNVEAWPAQADATTTVESDPPVVTMQSLPAFSRSPATIRWSGYDRGGSGIAYFDVQVRAGAGGSWTDWRMSTIATSGQFDGPAGETYTFRVRGVDLAQNAGTWSIGDGQAQTTLYAWAIRGTLRDNRGTPVEGGSTTVVPGQFAASPSDREGAYVAYSATGAATYSVDWAKTGYGDLPATAYPFASDVQSEVVLPPADNIVLNGGFESGSLAPHWTPGGSIAPMVSQARRKLGQASAHLGCLLVVPETPGSSSPAAVASTIAQTVSIPSQAGQPTLSLFYRMQSADPSGSSRFAVDVENQAGATTVFSATASTAWTHVWVDLGPWAGQSVTVRLGTYQADGSGCVDVYVDEITIGAAYPDVWTSTYHGGSVVPGEQLTLTIRYGNRGGVPAPGVSLEAQLPPELEFVSASVPPSATTPHLRWELGELPARSSPAEILVTVRATSGAIGGNLVPYTIQITTAVTELETANNTAQSSVFIGAVLRLPLVRR